MAITKLPEVVFSKLTHLLTFVVEHWYEGFRYRDLDGWQGYPSRHEKLIAFWTCWGKLVSVQRCSLQGGMRKSFPMWSSAQPMRVMKSLHTLIHTGFFRAWAI